jgi:hypothetical protein
MRSRFHRFARVRHRAIARTGSTKPVAITMTTGPALAALWLPALMTLFAILAGPSFANVGPPVRVSLIGEPRAAVALNSFAGTIRIETGPKASLTDFSLSGTGWRIARLNAPVTAALAPNGELAVDFEAVPNDPGQPLVLTFLWNGKPVKQSFDLSADHALRLARPGRATPLPEGSPVPVPGVGRDTVKPLPHPAAPPESWRDEPDDARGMRSRDIRVAGYFAYLRSDGVGIGADGFTVKIMDEDVGVDDELGSTITGPDGSFDITVHWDQIESDPDLYVEFDAENTQANLEDDTWFITYTWGTDTHENYGGTYLNIGVVSPSDEGDQRALHILTDITRTWRWYYYGGKHCTQVDVMWPDNDHDTSYYTPAPWRNIHIRSADSWFEDTHSHEYGHHFVDDFGDREDPDYCNPGGYCDGGSDCGHCVWCPENASVAWSEGFAEYSGQIIPESYQDAYGTAAQYFSGVEGLDVCPQDAAYHDPEVTEGYFAAVLTDIDDSDHDSHPHFPGYADRLAMGEDEILACVDDHNPLTPDEFLFAFLDDNPGVARDLWETGMNSGYDIDQEQPGEVTGLTSTSHTIGVPSPDNTVAMHWTPALDDASGISGYAISWTAAPANPGATEDIENVNQVTSDELAPGTWYFNIRAHDRDGNWSRTWVSYGGIVIRAPEACDLEFYRRAGWDYELVPSSSNASTAAHCVVSSTLPGNTSGTYWNTTGTNSGESSTSAAVLGRVYADDAPLNLYNFGVIASRATFMALNRGSVLVAGGRHVFHCELDPYESIPETTEWDNDWGHQFIWTPLDLTAGTMVRRSAPGYIMAGFDHVNDGSTLYFNVDGLHMHGSAWWNAVVEWSESAEDFNSISLFPPSTGAQNGFDAAVAASFRPQGRLNALIVNRNQVSQEDWDIGVANWLPDPAAGYKAVYLQAGTANIGTQYTHNFAEDEHFTFKEFYVSSGDLGSLSALVWTDPPFTPLHVQWRDKLFDYGDLLDCAADSTTGADGSARLVFNVTQTGYNSLAFFRDPVDGSEPLAIHFKIIHTPPDFTPYFAAGWHSPAVPRPAADGLPTSVPLPDTLYGNMSNTYYNYSLRNESPGSGADLNVYVSLDGERDAAFHYASFPAGAYSRYNWTAPRVVSGGRHTFSLVIDPDSLVEELSDGNNVYGEQYCWSPLLLTPGQVQGIAVAPPERMGGWDEIRSGETRWYDCAGFRMAQHSGWWTAFAVMPGTGGNVDVRLHAVLDGVKDGFAANLAYSGWGSNRSDYVLVNYNEVAKTPYDAGVLEISGSQWYSTHCAAESYLGANPSGTYGPYALAAGQIIRLHEAQLSPGTWRIREIDDGGNVDFGLCLHDGRLAYQTKSSAMTGGAAWEQPAGTDEEIVVEIAEAGYYCLAVWKAVTQDLSDAGTYRLEYDLLTSDVATTETVPQRTRLAQPSPNPCHPPTTLAYDLAATEIVELSVFNLVGARMRTLLSQRQAPGHYRLVWDGRDDSGRSVAGGIYLARFTAGGVQETRKITMVR